MLIPERASLAAREEGRLFGGQDELFGVGQSPTGGKIMMPGAEYSYRQEEMFGAGPMIPGSEGAVTERGGRLFGLGQEGGIPLWAMIALGVSAAAVVALLVYFLSKGKN